MIVMRLGNDHTAGPRPGDGYPLLESYVADNDLALGTDRRRCLPQLPSGRTQRSLSPKTTRKVEWIMWMLIAAFCWS